MQAQNLLSGLASMLDDDEYNAYITSLANDITKNSGAWDEFSRQINEQDATRLKESMESPMFKLEIKVLYEKADAEKKGYVTYGKTTFLAFIDDCIEHFKLPKPKGGELVYRKLFNRFKSEQKLELQHCETHHHDGSCHYTLFQPHRCECSSECRHQAD